MIEARVYPGLGDNVYAMPVLARMAGDVFVRTPWPEMFWHLEHVYPMRSNTRLRTQAINERAADRDVWVDPPRAADRMDLGYLRPVQKDRVNMLQWMMDRAGVSKIDFTFPLKRKWLEAAAGIIGGRKVCIVQPPSLRTEALSPAKNPDPAHFEQAVHMMRARGFTTIAVTHLAEGQEWLDCVPCWDEEHQMHWTIVAALAYLAGYVVTRLGFLTPLGSAVGAKTFTIYGGYVPPSVVEHPSMPGLGHAAPDPFCSCMDKLHSCNKQIDTLEEDLERWIGSGSTC